MVVSDGASFDMNGMPMGYAITLNGAGSNGGGALKNSSSTAAGLSGLYASITLASNTTIMSDAGGININLGGTKPINGSAYTLTLAGTSVAN